MTSVQPSKHAILSVNSKENTRDLIDDSEEDVQFEIEFRSFDQKVSKILEDKGFAIEGDKHPITRVNRALLTNPEFANK